MPAVHTLPASLADVALAGSTVVVIDILRATTTISRALASGARQLYICQQIDEARMLATQSAVRPLLGGERQGRRIEGFDLGNSPAEYTPEVVDQRSIVFTTTNGTRAMAAAAGADRILLGAFVNLTALVDQLADDHRPLQLVCAGTNGEETSEDILFAGAVVDRLSQLGRSPRNPAAQLALAQWQQLPPAELTRQLESSRGGQNLVAAGLSADIGLAAQLDAWPVVGELDSEQMIVSRSQIPPPVAPQADTG